MPRYFFNLEDHVREEDNSGVVLDDDNAARIEAVIFAGDYLSDNPELIWDDRHFKVEVQDEAGTVLLNVNVAAEAPGESSR